MRLCLGLCVGVCVLDWVRVFVCQCIQDTCLHALRQTQPTLQQNGTLAALQTELLSPRVCVCVKSRRGSLAPVG